MKFRFSIRDLLWLTALVAMALAWWISQSRLERDLRKELIEETNKRHLAEIENVRSNEQLRYEEWQNSLDTTRPARAPNPKGNPQ
jgi:hypothetical protein